MFRAWFQRFVAVFVGGLLILAVFLVIMTGDESMMLTTFLIAALYAIYLIRFVRKERARRDKTAPEQKSPLYRR